MSAEKFKKNMVAINNIQFKRMNDGRYFMGLKAKDEFIDN